MGNKAINLDEDYLWLKRYQIAVRAENLNLDTKDVDRVISSGDIQQFKKWILDNFHIVIECNLLDNEFNKSYPFVNGISSIRVGLNKWGYIKEDGTWLIEPKFNLCYPFINGVAVVKMKKYRFIKEDGTWLTNKGYDETIKTFVNGYIPVRIGNKWGYVKDDGTWLIEPNLSLAYICEKRGRTYGRFHGEDTFGMIDESGNIIYNI